MHKLTLIPLLGVLFTVAPLAAFADTPSAVVTPSLVYADDVIHNLDEAYGNHLGLLDVVCSGLGSDGNGHDYNAEIFSPDSFIGPYYIDIAQDCSESQTNNLLWTLEGIGRDMHFEIVVYDQSAVDTWMDNNVDTGSPTLDYYDLIENVGGWLISTSSVDTSSSTRPI